MSNSILPWQQEAWLQAQQLRHAMPHALLLHGPAGIGKTAFAECLARSLLCESPASGGHACGSCLACGWFAQYSHMDYRRVRPEALESADADGDGADAADDDAAGEGSGKTRKASTEIRIAQIRSLAGFVNITTHRHGLRVILLHPAEALNAESSNALLKMLEEPPPGTVFLLVTDSPDSLLPTIVSRCRKFALPVPSREQALAWLREQGIADPEIWLAEQGGAPLAALEEARSARREEMDEFLSQLARPSPDGIFRIAERLQKVPTARLIAWLQRWLYDLFSLRFAGRVRYYPRHERSLATLAESMNVAALLEMLKSVNERARVADHPLVPRLVIEDVLLDYVKVVS